MVPIEKKEPEAGIEFTVAEQLSVAVTLKFTNAPQFPASTFTLMLLGTDRTGNSVSITVTEKEHDVEFPDESLATEWTIVVPTGNDEPGEGLE